MRNRWFDWLLALAAGALAAAMVLVPAGPKPEDLDLEIVSVRELPSIEGDPQQVEVEVRWHWNEPPRRFGYDMVTISADGRWIRTRGGSIANGWLLTVLDKPPTLWGDWVKTPDEDKATFLIQPWPDTSGRASAIQLQAHYIHEAPSLPRSWPDRSWVKSVGGTYPLEAEPTAPVDET